MSLTPPETDIHDLIHELTEPHDIPILDRGRRLGTRHQTALLIKLRNATTATIGTAATGTGTTAAALHERSTLNSSAAELHTAIEKRIRQWALTAGYRPRGKRWPNSEHVLRIWYARTRGTDLTAHTATLRGWVNTITDLIVDPPLRWTLDAPCPQCGQAWAVTITDGQAVRAPALTITEREPVNDSLVICRACNTVWKGIDGARELAGLIATPTATPEQQATA